MILVLNVTSFIGEIGSSSSTTSITPGSLSASFNVFVCIIIVIFFVNKSIMAIIAYAYAIFKNNISHTESTFIGVPYMLHTDST